MYEIITSSQFRRDIKRCKRQNKNMLKFKEINELLIAGIKLPLKHQDHFLCGQWSGFRECHIEPDWLLIYKIDEQENILEYVRTGSHSVKKQQHTECSKWDIQFHFHMLK